MVETAPNFIYVGAPKSGSTWLFRALQEHPEVFVLPAKSSGYFEAAAPGPLAPYLAQFSEAGAARAVGEISHDVYVVPDAAERIAAAFPDMKILLCLREPGDFAVSVLKWWNTHTESFGVSVAEIERNDHFRRLTDYLPAVARFYQHFPAGQIQVSFFEDLGRDPATFLSDIHRFLDVSTTHRPSVLDTVVNKARPPRNRRLTKFIYAGGGVMRRWGMGTVVERAKTMKLLDAILYRSGEPPANPEFAAAASRVRERVAGDLPALEALIGRPLPREWYAS